MAWENSFDKDDLLYGYMLYKDHKVTIDKIKDGHVEAKVLDDFTRYVEFDIREKIIDHITCTCDEGLCAHVAAVFYELERHYNMALPRNYDDNNKLLSVMNLTQLKELATVILADHYDLLKLTKDHYEKEQQALEAPMVPKTDYQEVTDMLIRFIKEEKSYSFSAALKLVNDLSDQLTGIKIQDEKIIYKRLKDALIAYFDKVTFTSKDYKKFDEMADNVSFALFYKAFLATVMRKMSDEQLERVNKSVKSYINKNKSLVKKSDDPINYNMLFKEMCYLWVRKDQKQLYAFMDQWGSSYPKLLCDYMRLLISEDEVEALSQKAYSLIQQAQYYADIEELLEETVDMDVAYGHSELALSVLDMSYHNKGFDTQDKASIYVLYRKADPQWSSHYKSYLNEIDDYQIKGILNCYEGNYEEALAELEGTLSLPYINQLVYVLPEKYREDVEKAYWRSFYEYAENANRTSEYHTIANELERLYAILTFEGLALDIAEGLSIDFQNKRRLYEIMDDFIDDHTSRNMFDFDEDDFSY